MKRSICCLAALLAACSSSSGRPPAKELVIVPPPPASGADPATPVIDEVRVEKDNVCEGEETLVSVRAHVPNGDDHCLHYTIASSTGRQVPVRLPRGGLPPTALAFGCANQAVSVQLPIQVWDCHAPGVVIVAEPVVNTAITYRFDAALEWADGFVPVTYRWDFGDGATAETTTPTSTHDFWQLVGGDYLQILVTVTAVDASGAQVKGRVALQVLDEAAAWRARGVALVYAQPVGFGEVDDTGAVVWDWLLWHREAGPVTLDQAVATKLHRNAPTEDVPVDLSSLATVPALQPGERTQVRFRHDFGLEPADVYCINYALRGQGPDLPAGANVSLFAPVPGS